jgi:hypothetical protein
MAKTSDGRRLDGLTLREYEPVSKQELRALTCANLAGPALSVDRILLARLLMERDELLATFESARLLLEELESEGLIAPAGDDETALARYAVALKRYMDIAESVEG